MTSFFILFLLVKCINTSLAKKRKKYGIPYCTLRSIQVKVFVYTVDIRSIRRSVENTITMDTRGRILMRKPVRISLTEIYTLVKNVTALYEIDGITARPEKKDRFRYRASIIGIFLVFLDLYRRRLCLR